MYKTPIKYQKIKLKTRTRYTDHTPKRKPTNSDTQPHTPLHTHQPPCAEQTHQP